MEDRPKWQEGLSDGRTPTFLQAHADEKASKMIEQERLDYLKGFLTGRNERQKSR